MEFGDRLLLLLNEKEITQRDFAAMLNIAPTTLNGYIKNKRQPDFSLVRQTAYLLNVSADYLIGCENAAGSLNEHELTLISKLRKMDEKDKKIVYELVNIIDKI